VLRGGGPLRGEVWTCSGRGGCCCFTRRAPVSSALSCFPSDSLAVLNAGRLGLRGFTTGQIMGQSGVNPFSLHNDQLDKPLFFIKTLT
jgi:hypothetical protein